MNEPANAGTRKNKDKEIDSLKEHISKLEGENEKLKEAAKKESLKRYSDKCQMQSDREHINRLYGEIKELEKMKRMVEALKLFKEFLR